MSAGVRVALFRPQLGASGQARAGLEDGTVELRFGNQMLVLAAEEAWGSVRRRLATARLREVHRAAPRSSIHLVVQLGNLFQRAYPDVPVLLDKGRYLVVEVAAERAAEVATRGGCCYTVRPLGESRTVFDVRPPGSGRAATQGWVQALLGGLARADLEEDLRYLTSLPSRHSLGTGFREAAAWARQRIESLGFAARVEAVPVAGGESLNLIAERRVGAAEDRGVILVTAHLDSVNSLGDATAAAPGADDNGSGSAGVLALGKALATHRGRHDLRLILFGGEEQGLFGSTLYVDTLSEAERRRIRAVVNMDMVATRNTDDRAVLIEGGVGVSERVLEGLAAAAGAYTSLGVQTSLEPYNSDHVPFIKAGVPAVLTIEGTDRANANVHTANDTLQHIDYELMLQILAMNTAFVATALGEPGGETTVTGKKDIDKGAEVPATPGGMSPNPSLADVLSKLSFQLSGRYQYNGGASLRQGRSFVDFASGTSSAALADPLYGLDEPVYLRHTTEQPTGARSTQPLRFTLHVDVDGSEPLGAVSGTVALGSPAPGAASRHFIGRVTADDAVAGGRLLTVTDFAFDWPGEAAVIDRLEIELSGTPLTIPTAKVTFHPRGGGSPHGPYVATQQSIYFREVEMDVDVEDNAVACEPLDTHVHPDRPTDVPQEILTLETAFARAGIRITRSPGSGNVVPTPGASGRWSYSELHDSMELHWQAFANKPQWKMWIFLAELATSDQLGGVMFDGEINEPGGVDRQGTAIFTHCPYFHTAAGGYIQANPPFEEAIKRELFFNLMHETGHAFNLAHSFQKELGEGWEPPAWMPLQNNNQALSWMNYPDSATPGGGGANASWFYRRFRFGFEAGELLFLRHAPETYVEMGGETWFEKHGRVARISVDPRLELILRGGRSIELYGGRTAVEAELGEPIILELRLRNRGPQPLAVHGNLDPSDGLVELAVTNPKGERRPYLPFDHTRTRIKTQQLAPDERLYEEVDLTMGAFGFPFKEPGPYRIEATYRNLDGGTAAAVLQLYVRPARTPDAVPVVSELFDARVGRTLYVEGTRVMDDVNDKLDWVRGRLATLIGPENPLALHLRTVRYLQLGKASKLVDPDTRKLERKAELPEEVVRELAPVVENCDRAATTMGHIWLERVLHTYADAADKSNERAECGRVMDQAAKVFEDRGVVQRVVTDLRARATTLSSGRRARRSAAKPGPSGSGDRK